MYISIISNMQLILIYLRWKEIDYKKIQSRSAKQERPQDVRLTTKKPRLVFGQEAIEEELLIGNTRIENVTEFWYLGSLLTWDNDCNKEIKRRIARATGAIAGFKTLSNS